MFGKDKAIECNIHALDPQHRTKVVAVDCLKKYRVYTYIHTYIYIYTYLSIFKLYKKMNDDLLPISDESESLGCSLLWFHTNWI